MSMRLDLMLIEHYLRPPSTMPALQQLCRPYHLTLCCMTLQRNQAKHDCYLHLPGPVGDRVRSAWRKLFDKLFARMILRGFP